MGYTLYIEVGVPGWYHHKGISFAPECTFLSSTRSLPRQDVVSSSRRPVRKNMISTCGELSSLDSEVKQ